MTATTNTNFVKTILTSIHSSFLSIICNIEECTLKAVQNRVRYLIRDQHWGEEGRYKEAVLRNIMRGYLPEGVGVRKGFIIHNCTGLKIRRKEIGAIGGHIGNWDNIIRIQM